MKKIPKEIKRLLNDEIDEWIFEKFGLLPGCCSSILELEYNIAREVAEALWPKVNLPEKTEEAAEEYANKVSGNCSDYEKAKDGFINGVEWRERQLNWIRDLIQAAKKKPEEALAILTRIGRLLNN